MVKNTWWPPSRMAKGDKGDPGKDSTVPGPVGPDAHNGSDKVTTYDISVDEGNGSKFRIYNQPETTVREMGLLPSKRQLGVKQTTGDATFDLTRAGRKVRCLDVPFNVDNRELGQKQTMTFTGRTVYEAKAKADAYFKDLVGATSALLHETNGMNARISALERDERKYNFNSDELGEFSVEVDRKNGKVGGR